MQRVPWNSGGMYDAASAPSSPGGPLAGPDFAEELKELQGELYGKIVRRLRAKASVPDEPSAASEFPIHTSTFTRGMEQAVAVAPRAPRPRRREREPFTIRSAKFVPDLDGAAIPTIPAGTPGVFGVNSSATFKTTIRARPKSAPAKNMHKAHQPPRDNLSAGGVQRTSPVLSTAPAGGGSVGVTIKPQSAPHMRPSPNTSEHDASAQGGEDQNPAMHTAIAQILSEHAATRSEGAVALASAAITQATATSLAYSGALDSICAVVKELVLSGESHSTTCVQLLGVVFRVGAMESCCRAAAEALCSVLGDSNDQSGAADSRRRAPSASHHSAPFSDKASPGALRPSTFLGASSPADKAVGELSGRHSGLSRHAGDTPRSLGMVYQRMSDDDAEELVASGTMLWVYSKSGKSALSFVQLTRTGDFFIQGKLQKVVVTGAMQGMSERLRAKAMLSKSQRNGSFRLSTWVRDDNNPHFVSDLMSDDSSEDGKDRVPRVFDLRAPTASDTAAWIRGVTVIAQRNGTAPRNPELQLHKKSFVDLCCQVCGEELRKGVDSYDGERDELGHPRGRATATWRDGTRHIGMWRNDQPHGKGLLVLSGGERYVGEFEEGAACGYGVLFGSKGEKYEGEFVANARDGFGCEYEGKLLVYCGGYREGLREGEGICFGAPKSEGGAQPMSTCVYSDGVLEHSYELPEGDKPEEREVYVEAMKAANVAREAAVDSAKLLKEIQELAAKGALH